MGRAATKWPTAACQPEVPPRVQRPCLHAARVPSTLGRGGCRMGLGPGRGQETAGPGSGSPKWSRDGESGLAGQDLVEAEVLVVHAPARRERRAAFAGLVRVAIEHLEGELRREARGHARPPQHAAPHRAHPPGGDALASGPPRNSPRPGRSPSRPPRTPSPPQSPAPPCSPPTHRARRGSLGR